MKPDRKFLESEGFKFINDENVFLCKNKKLLYFERTIQNKKDVEKFLREHKQKYQGINYFWYYDPTHNKLYVYRKFGELRWFTYSDKITRTDIIKSKEDQLNKISDNLNLLFDVSAITNKFYNELLRIMIKMAQSIEEHNIKNKNKLLVIQKFIDRTMFFYFIAQKGLVEIKVGDTQVNLKGDNIREFIKSVKELLNNKELKKFFDGLYFSVFSKFNPKGFSIGDFKVGNYQFTIVVPSLNGGLFKEGTIEGFLESKIDFNHIDELIDLLNSYNWIIGDVVPEVDENIVGELTPEVIGHIYEKFAVSLEKVLINKEDLNFKDLDELVSKKRKEGGVYYTPEEITNYICKNTIFKYITDKLNESGYNIKNIWYDVLNKKYFNEKDIECVFTILSILKDIKICDNACGSGSFLITAADILVKIYSRCLKILRDYDQTRYSFLSEKYPELEKSIEKFIIVNNIYGIDIMEGSVEIAKLRLWLWYISKTPKSKIEPLPNLDYNVKCGNSLIGFVKFEDVGYFALESLKDVVGKIKSFKWKHAETAEKDKEEIEKVLNELRKRFDQEYYKMYIKSNKKLKDQLTFEEFKEKLKPFHWCIEFPDVFYSDANKEICFDIIVGNPPYIRQERINDIVKGVDYKEILSKLYDPYDKTFDFSMLFIL